MSGKNQLTDEERLSLAAKLDKELEEFMSNLPKRQQQEFPSFDKWEEEIQQHPFFMKEIPQSGDKLHPLYEGLQKLKYDPDENEPEELALAYKDDGNFHYKHKKYRMAVISYTEGLKAKCDNTELNAQLYNNRAAAQFFLKNYRSCILDCEAAINLKSDYCKAILRAAQASESINKLDKALNYYNRYLLLNPDDKKVRDLKDNCMKNLKISERDRRKRDAALRKKEKEDEKLLDAIKSRNIQICGSKELSVTVLEPQFPALFDSKVHFDENTEQLVWPCILFYPEYKIMDYIQNFFEETTILEQLHEVFSVNPEWDTEKKYNVDNLNVYYEDVNRKIVKVNLNKKLIDVLQEKGFQVMEGVVRFIILVAGSSVEKNFLKA